MRLFPKVFWITAFLAATFCWMVLFQHGFTWQGFTSGARVEFNALVELVRGTVKGQTREPAPPSASSSNTAPKKPN